MINFIITPDYVEAFLGTCEGLSFICTSLNSFKIHNFALSIANFIFCIWTGLETAENLSILFLVVLHFCLNIYMISVFLLFKIYKMRTNRLERDI